MIVIIPTTSTTEVNEIAIQDTVIRNHGRVTTAEYNTYKKDFNANKPAFLA